MKLHELKPPAGARHSRKRLGRGDASGHGATSTRGNKGENSRSGTSHPFNFEGGQMPLMRRLPKRGFTHLKKNPAEIVNLQQLDKLFTDGQTVGPDELLKAGLLKKGLRLKVLGQGALTKKLSVHAHAVSRKAAAKITAAGGTVVLLGRKTTPAAAPSA
jgi:large subunit ribosomal protein L15